ncbi:MAG: hypothetical protein ACXVY3_01175 [Gaiellaceae bacterium]
MAVGDLLAILGAGVITVWGLAHIAPTRAVVAGFEPLSTDNRRILTMEWVAEGVTLCFVGVLSAIVTLSLGADDHAAALVNLSLAGLLVVMAALTQSTGGRTSIVPMKLCPLVKLSVATLLVVGTLV